MENAFLKGRFLKIIRGHCTCGDVSRDTLISVNDIVRVRACKVDIVEGEYATNTSRIKSIESALVVTAIGRSNNLENGGNDFYMLTDSEEVIAEALHRDPDDLAALLLQLEVGNGN